MKSISLIYWLPGPLTEIPVYAAALVGFLNLGVNVGWFPLGSYDYYWPPYPFSRGYFININIGGARIASGQLANIYRNRTILRNSANLSAAGVTAVSAAAFRQGRPVSTVTQTVSKAAFVSSKRHDCSC
jgi:hypothetical protein